MSFFEKYLRPSSKPPLFESTTFIQEKPEIEYDLQKFLKSKNNGILYINTTTLAYSKVGNFLAVSLSHLGKGDVFNKKIGRANALERLLDGQSILIADQSKSYGLDVGAYLREYFHME